MGRALLSALESATEYYLGSWGSFLKRHSLMYVPLNLIPIIDAPTVLRLDPGLGFGVVKLVIADPASTHCILCTKTLLKGYKPYPERPILISR